ncbi:MAG: hypothetical protein AB8G22_09485 [Saprospiraceae bacterium]
MYILLILFCTGAGIPKGDFSQLTKINDLMEHYQLHQEEATALGEAITFVDFLYLHFITGEEHQHDTEDDHNNLPLQQFATTTFLLTATEFSCGLSLPLTPSVKQEIIAIFSSEVVAPLYHPPCLFHLT